VTAAHNDEPVSTKEIRLLMKSVGIDDHREVLVMRESPNYKEVPPPVRQ